MTEPLRIGKYEITGEVGRGAMGVVYKALDPDIRREVALKVIRKHELEAPLAAEIIERFRREAQAAGNVSHPNIVAIYEYGEDDQHAYIAMEYVAGKSLRDHLVAGYRPELASFPEILDQMLDGLEYLHSRGVVHRDIKPANLLISEMGVAKISDFGIARVDASHLTRLGEVLGTPYYMSPEQFEGERVDERSDVYSAAVMIYEVLTGQRPFDGTAATLLKSILSDEPPRPSAVNEQLPRAIDDVLLKALAKRPEDRYATPKTFAGALHLAFDKKPVARPDLASPAGRETTFPPQADAGLAGKAQMLRRALGNGAAGTAPAAAVPVAAGKRPCVLFVDDEARIVNALRSLFEAEYDVETAISGAEALAIMKRRHVHLVVSDQRMPGMPGVEVLRQAKGMSPATVRILLTGYSDLAAIVGSVNDGEVYRFVSKPWNSADLSATVAEAVAIAIALEASPPREPPVLGPDVVAVVLDDDTTFRAVRELVGTACATLQVRTIEATLAALEEREVAVLVADLDAGGGDNTPFFKLLKREHPHTLVLVTSASSDSETIIALINEAKIYRFVKKPLNLVLLKEYLLHTLERYRRFKAQPALLRTERVKPPAEPVEATLGKVIVERLRALGARFGSAFR